MIYYKKLHYYLIYGNLIKYIPIIYSRIFTIAKTPQELIKDVSKSA